MPKLTLLHWCGAAALALGLAGALTLRSGSKSRDPAPHTVSPTSSGAPRSLRPEEPVDWTSVFQPSSTASKLLPGGELGQALAAALQMPDGEARSEQVAEILGTWAEVDPGAAVAWARRQSEPLQSVGMLAVLGALGDQPEAAHAIWRSILRVQREQAPGYGAALITALGKAGEFSAGWAVVEETPQSLRPMFLGSLFLPWIAEQNPEAIAAFESIDDEGIRNQVLEQMLPVWSRAHPDTLAAYALALAPGELRNHLLEETVEGWLEQDVATPAEQATRSLALETLFEQWAASDLPAARELLNRHPRFTAEQRRDWLAPRPGL